MGSHGEKRLRQGGANAMSAGRHRLGTAAAALIIVLAGAAAGFAQGRDEVRQALLAGAHEKAIGLALEALRADPGNAEIRFLLARAYAYSGRWDEAEAILVELLTEHPADTDLLVFKARLLCWRKDLAGAERTFQRALELQPRSADALAGLADLASWRGEYDAALVYCRRALDFDANHAGALFRVGSILLWQGNYGLARAYLARAVDLEPRNADFGRALERAVPLFARRSEIWLAGRNEHWSDGRQDSSDLGLAALFDVFGRRARLVVKANRSWRGGGHDDQLGLEAYPHLWKGAYGYADVSLAPNAASIPLSSVHLEIYQSVLKRYEVSLGARRMRFATGGVTVLAASAAAYWGVTSPARPMSGWASAAAPGPPRPERPRRSWPVRPGLRKPDSIFTFSRISSFAASSPDGRGSADRPARPFPSSPGTAFKRLISRIRGSLPPALLRIGGKRTLGSDLQNRG